MPTLPSSVPIDDEAFLSNSKIWKVPWELLVMSLKSLILLPGSGHNGPSTGPSRFFDRYNTIAQTERDKFSLIF